MNLGKSLKNKLNSTSLNIILPPSVGSRQFMDIYFKLWNKIDETLDRISRRRNLWN